MSHVSYKYHDFPHLSREKTGCDTGTAISEHNKYEAG